MPDTPADPTAAGTDGRTAADTPAPIAHVEIETKLDVDAAFRIPDLHALPGLPPGARPSEPVVLHLRATYYDTRHLDLVNAKVTLRRREGGIDDGWHLKLPAGAGARREIGVPLRSGGEGADQDSTPPESLAQLVTGVARGRKLRPVVQFATTRTMTRIVLPDGTALVEIADDAVTATRLRSGAASRPELWREVEVEVLDGTPEQMGLVSESLTAAGARPSGSASKLARALGVSDDHRAEDIRPPSAGDVVLAALRGYRQQLLTADIGLRFADPAAEALHDSRAAARRIRSIIKVYSPLFLAGSVDGVSAGLKRVGGIIGATRDLDIAAGRVLAALSSPADHGSGNMRIAEQLTEHLARRRGHHLQSLQAYLAGKRYRRTVRAIDELIGAPPFTSLANTPATEALPPLLTAAWFGLRALAEAALADPDAAHKAHEVRKDAKAVRYAAETATRALGAGAQQLEAFAEQLQEILGEHQDAVTTAAAVRSGDHGPFGALPSEVTRRLLADEEDDAARTFAEFTLLWTSRPKMPGESASVPEHTSRHTSASPTSM